MDEKKFNKEVNMETNGPSSERLSPWWRKSVILIMIFGFGVLIWMAVSAHLDAPPIPEKWSVLR
jgi:nitric oxide reductase subunit B